MFGGQISCLPVVDADQIGPMSLRRLCRSAVQQHYRDFCVIQSCKYPAVYFLCLALEFKRRKKYARYLLRYVLLAEAPGLFCFLGVRVCVSPKQAMLCGLRSIGYAPANWLENLSFSQIGDKQPKQVRSSVAPCISDVSARPSDSIHQPNILEFANGPGYRDPR